ncbi:CDP-L-myo-inositol myo-inositolphosphotransferase [Hydrogenivirga caldilitoris]|uniref:Bifunctional IPC transferase and DIPP synthase n=1 Tax=Hydrogenivirga caldilitoris TaxID=246264 RepID=A0A497XP82_9AQUI|nr:bifunctional L-myo-inositol-1-phosphate cytidylyltransferase/CDP-L-myo-inositol myo-inositolphosphotransferase [Hydrogenivirga caldilitoris]RLJ70678.1 CDP-L-myo-inositol myo-inositolphosphotransferase [Hydrogenivirga caldilitoris]
MDTAVILCAGLAKRMQGYTQYLPKPLIRVAGREILYRTIKLLDSKGISKFVLVVNEHNREPIENFVRRLGISYEIVLNEHPEKENGYSLYLARNHVNGRFVLTMGDHLYSEEFIEEALKGEGLIVDELALYTDRKEATKVLCKEGKIEKIGKDLKNFNGYDTGFFILDESVFETAERLVKEREKVTLSEIVKEAHIKCTPVSGKFWTDVDTPEDIERAKKALVRASVKGTGDGFISRHLNRKVSLWFSERLVDKLTPNRATWLTFFIGVFSALVALLSPALGGLLYQLSSMLDGIDGEIARASMRTTRFGGYLDSVLDRYTDFLFLSSLALWLKPSQEFLPWVLLAIFGSLMVSYSTERFRGAYCEDAYGVVKELRWLPGKRDERIFFIMLFCLFGWIKALFILLALVTNVRVILTLWLVWKHRGSV